MQILKTNIIVLFLLVSVIKAFSQVVTITPTFATQSDNIVITFDATQGNAALLGQSVIYAHTGVITDQSSSPTSWKYVQGNWGTDDAKVKMTNIGNNKFQLQYNINTFYGVPNGEKVLKLAFVFRNQDGSKVGREINGGDIFVPLSDGSFNIKFVSPSQKLSLLTNSDSILLDAISSAKSLLRLYIDDSLIQELSTDSILKQTIYASIQRTGKHIAVVSATLSGNTSYDTTYFIVRNGSNTGVAPAGIMDGINYINDSTVILQLFAPYKSFVYAIGDFSDWEIDPLYEMKRTPDGNRYWIQLTHLQKLTEYRYQYAVDIDLLKIADPYADKVLDPDNDQSIPSITYPSLIPYPSGKTSEIVSIFQTGQSAYNWQYSTAFTKPSTNKLIIYELLVRDFIARHDFQTLKDTLSYLQSIGINAIEVMPFNEFEGNESWGYNTSFYFAPDKYYGTKNALKAFIDECHHRGIAVIMDMVLNHSFGQSPFVRLYFDQSTGQTTSNSPWFNQIAKHPYNVGYDFNHESLATQDLVDRVLAYWINEYKVDGYRFDLSKGFTQTNSGSDVSLWGQYDQSRINIWKRIADKIRLITPEPYLILEHFADNSEEKVLSNYGFMLWGNMNHDYNEATMGYTSNFSGVSYQSRGWTNPLLVGYMESHDEERIMFKNITYGNTSSLYNIKNLNTALARVELAACFFIPVPGPKMIWQFGEMGYDISIDQNGRLGNKPIYWDYLLQPNRKRLTEVFTSLNKLKTTYNTFSTNDYSLSASGFYKILKLNDSIMNVVIVGNFGMTPLSQSPVFQHTGWWYDYFSGDSILINTTNDSILLNQGQYKFYTDIPLTKPDITERVGIHEMNDLAQEIIVYPNPASNELNISTPFSPITIQLFNSIGELMLNEKQTQQSTHTFNTQNLSSGIYFIKISGANLSLTRKILIN